MKTKPSGLVPYLLAAAAAVALLHAAPPPDDPALPAADRAKRKVAVEIYAKVNTSVLMRFSRAGPRPSHQLEFQPELLVDGEARLPFAIVRFRGKEPGPAVLKGYVRLADQEVYLLDPATGAHRLASQDPRFAPPPTPVQVVPVKPA